MTDAISNVCDACIRDLFAASRDKWDICSSYSQLLGEVEVNGVGSGEMCQISSDMFDSWVSDVEIASRETSQTHKSHPSLPWEVQMNVVESWEMPDDFSNMFESGISDVETTIIGTAIRKTDETHT